MANFIKTTRSPGRRWRRLVAALALLVPAATAWAAPRPVVLELFTSNGCSSCPPAYALLSDLRENPPADDIELILLNQHVDYWDNLGWVDPFSGAQYTDRQRGYARNVFGSGRVYTPQLVVDGRREMVGSRRGEVTAAIKAQADAMNLPVTLNIARDGARAVTATVDLGGNARDGAVQVWLAMTQDDVVTHVGGGENGGRSLHEDGVVHQLVPAQVVAGQQRYSARLSLPSRAPVASLAVVAFVQRVPSRAIVGATRTPLSQTSLSLKASPTQQELASIVH